MKLSTSISTVVIYTTLCISALLLSNKNGNACGPDFTGCQYRLLLEHYTFNHRFFSYQFAPYSRFYSLSRQEYNEEDMSPKDETQYNIASWRNYLNLSDKLHDSTLKNFIYGNSTVGIQKKSLQPNESNEIEKSINGKKNAKEIWQYFILLNRYKEVMAPPQDVWDYSSYTNLISMDTVQPFIQECEEVMQKTDDVFLQWRLLYVILRASHFNKHHAVANAAFEKYYPKITHDHSLAQYWCEGIYAGALLRTHQHHKSIYYTARAFANCPDQHMQAMNTYLFGNRNWKSALPLCRNANDSVYVAMLEGANHLYPDIGFVQLVYQSNPNSEVLKFLWLREASKIETYLFGGENREGKNIFSHDGDRAEDMDSMYAATKTLLQFLNLSEKILNSPLSIPAKVSVANTLAFYYYKKEDYAKALNCLNKITDSPKDEMEQSQYELLMNLIELKSNRQFSSNKFAALLDKFKNIPYGAVNHHVGYYLLFNEIAPHLLSQKDTSAAFWAYTYANCFDADSFHLYAQDYSPEGFNYANFASYLLTQHFTIHQVSELKENYLKQKGKSDFETYLIRKTKLVEGVKLFNLVIAQKYMLAQQWEMALKMYHELPVSYTERLGANPANFYVNDYLEDDETQIKKSSYTPKQIIELAQKLKSIADENTAASAKDKLLYGTLLYNLSYYGKNHYVLDNHWNHNQSNTAYFKYDSINTHIYLNGDDRYEMPLHESYQNYFHLNVAESYLNAALPILNADEDKARCTFLLAKCWQKKCPKVLKYNVQYQYMEDLSDYVGNSIKNPYFKNLTALYKGTKTQEQIFNSCSYYRMYLGKK